MALPKLLPNVRREERIKKRIGHSEVLTGCIRPVETFPQLTRRIVRNGRVARQSARLWRPSGIA